MKQSSDKPQHLTPITEHAHFIPDAWIGKPDIKNVKTSTRGGARPGSGRKMGKEQKTTVSFRVTDLTKMNIACLRDRGYDVTGLIEAYLDKLTDDIMNEETRDD